jgi:hypothetical protein
LLKHGFFPYQKDLNTLLLTDQRLSKKLLIFRVLFNFTIYSVRCQVETKGGTLTNPLHIISSFENTARTYCPALIGLKQKRLFALTQFKTQAIAKVKELINTLDNDTVLCFTDGSANPNPGSSGAGIYIAYRDFTYTTYTSLGPGTNNTGELYAIGMACDALSAHSKELAGAKRVIILPDSLYAIGTLIEGWKAKANIALIRSVKGKLHHLYLPYSFLYCPGHCDIQGNEEADYRAGLGTLDSANGLGLTINQRLSYFNNDFCHPINSNGIQHANNMPPD